MSVDKIQEILDLADRFYLKERYDLAIKIWRKFLLVHPDHIAVLQKLASVLFETDRLAEAESVTRVALERASGNASIWILLGKILSQWGEESRLEAEECFHNAVARDGDNPENHVGLGDFYLTQNRLMEAMASYQVASDLDPQSPAALMGLGEGWWRRNQQEQALKCFRQAYENSRSSNEEMSYEVIQFSKNRLNSIEELHRTRLAQKAEFKYGLALLAQGRYLEGWKHFEARLGFSSVMEHPDLPLWDGTNLKNRQLIIIPEGGMSDLIQFSRIAGLVARAYPDATIVLRVPDDIKPLLSTVDWTVKIQGHSEEYSDAIAWVPLLSIPSIMKMDIWDIPAAVPYIKAERSLLNSWYSKLGDKLTIAIAWHGNDDKFVDQRRDIPLSAFEPLSKLDNVQLVSLQKGIGRKETQTVSFPILDFNEELDEAGFAYVDTVAIIENAAIVVTVDNAIAHLAGALGKPVWVPVAESYHNWRWAQRERDTVWYPTMEIFKAEPHESWQDLIARLARRLELMQSGVDPDELDRSLRVDENTVSNDAPVIV